MMKISAPAKTIYRALDNQQKDERTIPRFLNCAAFWTRQQRYAIVGDHARALTLSAFTFWNRQERSKCIR